MKLNRGKSRKDDAGVDLSPLIDCVFLLLIFFLATTMFKKFEHQIPIQLPDTTSSLSANADEQMIHVGMRTGGTFHRMRGVGSRGELNFNPKPEPLATLIKDFTAAKLSHEHIRITIEKQTRFQDVITALDQFQLAGFQNVDIRVTHRVR